MHVIELTCIDLAFLYKVGKKLESKLKELNVKCKLVEPGDCMLGQALRLLSTYKSIPIHSDTRVYLDAAREYQNRLENIKPHENEDILIIKIGSFVAEMYTHYRREKSKKLTIKAILKRMAHPPDSLIYYSINLPEYFKRKRKFNSKYKVEHNLRGVKPHKMDRNMGEVFDGIVSNYGTKTCIMTVGEKAVEETAEETLKYLKEIGIISFE